TEDDVGAAIDFARENEVGLAVRGGGHSVPGFGTCDDGIVADLSPMHAVAVDVGRKPRRLRAGRPGGCSTTPPTRKGWRPPAASSPPPGSAASRSAAASGTWPGAPRCPATTFSRPR